MDRWCRTGERIAFGYLISQKYTGEHAQLLVLREGKELTLDITLSCPTPLVPLHLRGADPSYLIVAGGPSLPPAALQSLVGPVDRPPYLPGRGVPSLSFHSLPRPSYHPIHATVPSLPMQLSCHSLPRPSDHPIHALMPSHGASSVLVHSPVLPYTVDSCHSILSAPSPLQPHHCWRFSESLVECRRGWGYL